MFPAHQELVALSHQQWLRLFQKMVEPLSKNVRLYPSCWIAGKRCAKFAPSSIGFHSLSYKYNKRWYLCSISYQAGCNCKKKFSFNITPTCPFSFGANTSVFLIGCPVSSTVKTLYGDRCASWKFFGSKKIYRHLSY